MSNYILRRNRVLSLCIATVIALASLVLAPAGFASAAGVSYGNVTVVFSAKDGFCKKLFGRKGAVVRVDYIVEASYPGYGDATAQVPQRGKKNSDGYYTNFAGDSIPVKVLLNNYNKIIFAVSCISNNPNAGETDNFLPTRTGQKFYVQAKPYFPVVKG